jgi:hypothetical protein
MLREIVSKTTKAVKSFLARRSALEYFIYFMASSLAVYIIFYLIRGEGRYTNVFFISCNDLFMDFFNSVRDAAQGPAVYTVRHVIYPPMANLLYLVCSRFIPSVYADSSFKNRYTWTEHPEAIFFIMLFSLMVLIAIFIIIYETVKGGRRRRFLFAFFSVVNIPILYMVERGNMMLLCFFALLIYFVTYNSKNKLYREIGLIALAFTFSLKLYPVIFGWLLLVDKRFIDGLKCFIYGMLMLFIPSFWFGGPACFYQIYKNITAFSTGHTNAITVISGYSGIPSSLLSVLVYIWFFICVGAFVASPFVFKERWKVWMIGVIALMTIPSLTSVYMWSFFLIPIIMLTNGTKLRGKSMFYFIIMAILFVFTLGRLNHYLTFNSFAIYPLMAILSIVGVTDTAVTATRRIKAAKQKNNA